ncbi:hypothetical protein ZWY2020_032901 [Hordeum vulgare]|nr:hypothetical protein ZWY2020_032901 [Hordeum vulgare]
MTDFCRFPASPRADMITGISLFGVFFWFGKDASWFHMAGLASQMKRYCDCCKRYADHLDGKMRCFRRRMTTNFRDGMVIPNKFINHFGGKISRTIELESRNGSMYTVEVSKRNSPPAAWMGCISRCASRRGERLATRGLCIDISSGSGDDSTRSSGSKGFATCERGDSSHPRKTAVSNSLSEGDSGEDSDSEAEEHSEDESSFGLDDDRRTPCAGRDYVLCRSGRLSGAQEERVTRLLQDVRAETRVFVAIMKMNTRNRAIVIPKLFAEEHFPRESQNLTLQRPGKSKSWHPWFCVRKDQCGHTLYGTRRCNHGRQRARQHPKPARPYILSSTARLTEEQEREVERTARAIGSRVPVYVSVMNRSSVGVANRIYNATISGEYAAEYLPAGERIAVTLVRRKAWEVEMRARRRADAGAVLPVTAGCGCRTCACSSSSPWRRTTGALP